MVDRVELICLVGVLLIYVIDFDASVITKKATIKAKANIEIVGASLRDFNETELISAIDTSYIGIYKNHTNYSKINIATSRFIINSHTAKQKSGIVVMKNALVEDRLQKYFYKANKVEYHKSSGSLRFSGIFNIKNTRGALNGKDMLYNNKEHSVSFSNARAIYNIKTTQ